MIDVIIPFLYADDKLSQTVNSVLEKDYVNNCICINDGFDSSPKKSDSRLKFYNYKGNRGVSYARNFGISKTSAEYILFLDSGDLLKLECLPKGLMDINIFRYMSNNVSLDLVKKKDLFRSLIWGDSLVWICGVIFLREKILNYNVNFKENLHYGEDVDFLLRIMDKIDIHKMRIIDDFISIKKDHEYSLTQKGKGCIISEIKRYNTLRQINFSENSNNEIIKIFLFNLIVQIIHLDSISEFSFISYNDKRRLLKDVHFSKLTLGLKIKYLKSILFEIF